MLCLHDYLEYYARITPAHGFSSFDDHVQTYGEAAELASGIANMLAASGVTFGDRVAILSRNSDRFVPIICATSKIGAVAVPLNYRLAAAEINFILEDAKVGVLFIQSAEWERLRGEAWKPPEGCIVALIEELSPCGSAGLPAPSPSEVSIILQMYTSGTSGRPKGVLLTQRAVLTNAHQLETAIPYRLARQDRYLIVCPLYHAAALISAVMTLRAGGEAVIQAEFDAGAVVAALSGGEIAAATLVPTMISRCLDWASDAAPQRPGSPSFPALRHILYGAAPISPEVLTGAAKLFDCQFTQAFGLTETTSAATALTAEDHALALSSRPELLRACGSPLIGTTVRIDPASNEICIAGPQLMQGYAELPETSAAALSGGWFRSGDAGSFDQDGYLTIRDRIKDMVISGGENIYSIEVENALLAHPAIVDAAVIGIPDSTLGEALLAFVVTGQERPSEAAIIAHCRALLAGYKIPRRYEFVTALPRNPSGKVLKNQLRTPFLQVKSPYA